MKSINRRRWSSIKLGSLFFLVAASALAQNGGAAGEDSSGGGVAGEEPGAGGDSGIPSPGPGTRLGRECVDDQDCQDANTPDLTCVTATDTVLGSGAPPGGLCTSPCLTDDDCASLSAGAICYPFEATSGASYCVEGCSFGEPELGDVKCHARDDFACNPALLGSTGAPCASTASCLSGEICVDGVCNLVFPACLPACRGDLDCAAGMYCDQSFLSGVCVAQKPVGKALGEPCTVANEPDECLGFCQADAASGTQGHCATTCGLGTPCSWNASSEKFDGACFYGSVLTTDLAGLGDFGFCTPSCNCTEECNDPALVCQALSAGLLTDDFRGPGLCFSDDPEAIHYEQCAGGGANGAAGEPSSTGGTGGSRNPSNGGTSRGGTSGTDPSEGGETASTPGGSGDSSGCGCRTTPQSGSAAGAGLLLALVGMLSRRRRAS